MLIRDADRQSLKIVAVYAAVAAAWIAASGHLLLALTRDPRLLERLEIGKGFFFVAATSCLLYLAMRRSLARLGMAMTTLRELNHAYRMSAACEALMIRARDRQELFDGICRTIVDSGGHPQCWIGLFQEDARRSLVAAACAGRDARPCERLRSAPIAWSDGPSSRAIRGGEASRWTLPAGPSASDWEGVLREEGIRSALGLPFRLDGRVIGVLFVLSDETSAFDDAEASALERAAGSLSYALEKLERTERLRSQAERLRTLSQAVESSPVSIGITDVDFRFEHVNARFMADSGLAIGEVLGRTPWELGLDVTPEPQRAALRAELRAGREWRGLLASRAKDGRLFLESATIAPVRDEDGRIAGYIALKHDVTAQRQMDRAYRMIGACDRAMIRIRGRQELFDEICRIAVEEGGYLMSWVGLALDDAAKTIRPVARAGRDDGYVDAIGAVWSDEPRGRGPSGTAIREGRVCVGRFDPSSPEISPWLKAATERGYRASIALPLKEGDRTIGAFTMYSDRGDTFDPAETALLETFIASIGYALENISRREKELAQYEQLRKLSHAVEQSPVSIVITDAKGVIEYVNRKFSAVSGYSAAEALGRNPSVLKSGETPAETYAAMWKAITAGQVWQGEFANRAKDGTPFREWATVSPLRDDDGRITHYVAVKEDITAKRALELQLRHAQKMEAIGTLAGGIAHDFNNILTVIQGHCSLLEMAKFPTDLDRESVGEIQTSVERAAALTRQLLAFGRRQPMQARRVDLNESAGKMTRMLRRLLPERIALEAVLHAEPLLTHADPAMVDQALMNLVLNARDAMTGKGRILIETAPADGVQPPPHAADRGHGWVVLRVTDDGCGIPEKDFARIFEPFYTTKPTGKGSGLGLAVVDGVIRQHKGWVTVASESGRGSTFSLYLPRETADPKAAAPAAPTAVPRGTETILLAEDEAPLRRLVARGLTALGYRVLEAATGEGAEDVWSREKGDIRLLITDMVMPGAFGGDELARRLRQTAPDLAVVYISGYHTSPLGGAIGLEKRSAFLQKPFKPDELGRLVREVLDSR